ncbi:plant disease resistance polyprotein -like [Oryza sativa Japonica Group]|uniref:Plant disease resistance polyprotein-like n=1 Tax=Oryza sativa subsp. japonica TaxID=39947 RepID=Q5JL48_ORYSJ|nr:plant disease resistance polyprotein -like [Oryza sativa Japonica Group]
MKLDGEGAAGVEFGLTNPTAATARCGEGRAGHGRERRDRAGQRGEVGEEREAGFENRIPAIWGAGAGGRERGVGAGDAAHARTWATWPGGGGGVGAAAAVAGAAAAVAGAAAGADGGRLGKDPTGGELPGVTRRLWSGGGGRCRGVVSLSLCMVAVEGADEKSPHLVVILGIDSLVSGI